MRTLAKPDEVELNKDHTAFGLAQQRNVGSGTLKSLAGTRSRVEIEWDVNEACKRDAVFKLVVGPETVYLSKEQMLRFLRWV